ncbi:hypothetical protein F4820DRAFT_424973 [Hypoxylon rubiginosum]|uniref:Uncharacterized protein n=1 Tax=Hypoxylon rubiginosum TaxID=110542 RepID=A0ACB9YXD9_9PEZI|nr:hypothetical protein F4820DRAFT_424973 [Hypoxylon rubiginosum]
MHRDLPVQSCCNSPLFTACSGPEAPGNFGWFYIHPSGLPIAPVVLGLLYTIPRGLGMDIMVGRPDVDGDLFMALHLGINVPSCVVLSVRLSSSYFSMSKTTLRDGNVVSYSM